MADTPKHSVSVAGIVVDDQDRVLVIQRRDNGHWEPPGGVLELDETPEDGARREIAEETGVDVEVEALTGVYKNMSRGIVALVFKCRPAGGTTIGTDDEARRVAWLPVPDATSRMTQVYARRVIDAFAGPVSVRSHDGRRFVEANSRSRLV